MKLRPVLSALAALAISAAAVAQLTGDAGDLRTRAERGDVKAQLALGRALAPSDPIEAFAWLTLALDRGEASDEHAKLFRELTPVQYAAAEKRAAELRTRFGDSAAQVVPASVALANENADLKAQVEKLNRELSDAKAMSEGAALARARVTALEKELTLARSEAAVRDNRAGEASGQLRRDLDAAMQQRDALAEQLSQTRRERASAEMDRDTLRAEIASLRAQPAAAPIAAGDPVSAPATPSAPATDAPAVDTAELQRALREAQMKVDMTVRAFALKDEENQRSHAKVEQAAAAQAAAETARSEALAQLSKLEGELATAKQSEASALAAKGALQNELYAAQIRIENYSRAYARTGGAAAGYVPPTSGPVALESSGATIESTRPSSPASGATPVLADAPSGTAAGGAAAAGPRTHKVAEGETLSLLAFKYYGSPNKWDRIFAANRGKLKSADQVRPGIVLVIP